MDERKKSKQLLSTKSLNLIKYVSAILVLSLLIFIFSVFMASVASLRNGINSINYDNTALVYNGPLLQNSPNLERIDVSDSKYLQFNITQELAQKYTDNTFLTSTNGKVIIDADFVKKGLAYQPTYKTQFNAEYVLKNSLNEKSFIKFQFPFPINSAENEISNARLIINGEELKNAKTTFNPSTYEYYDYYQPQVINGMIWEGEIAPNAEIKIEVSYNTVGISLYKYEGIENPKGSQDFNFQVEINGTRSYNLVDGLSIDERKFDDNKVTLIWNKSDLYNKPVINISVGDKLNPSEQVSRIYLTMTPIYLVFGSIVIYLTSKFGRKIIGIFDLFLMTILFGIYFPLIHYLSSFTVDPTIDIFSNLNVSQYSMPLYLAFGLSFILVGGIIYYFIGKFSGFKFSTKFILPSLVLFLGFFPIVVTIPEYSMLLVIIGAIALISIIIQVRIRLMDKSVE